LLGFQQSQTASSFRAVGGWRIFLFTKARRIPVIAELLQFPIFDSKVARVQGCTSSRLHEFQVATNTFVSLTVTPRITFHHGCTLLPVRPPRSLFRVTRKLQVRRAKRSANPTPSNQLPGRIVSRPRVAQRQASYRTCASRRSTAKRVNSGTCEFRNMIRRSAKGKRMDFLCKATHSV